MIQWRMLGVIRTYTTGFSTPSQNVVRYGLREPSLVRWAHISVNCLIASSTLTCEEGTSWLRGSVQIESPVATFGYEGTNRKGHDV